MFHVRLLKQVAENYKVKSELPIACDTWIPLHFLASKVLVKHVNKSNRDEYSEHKANKKKYLKDIFTFLYFVLFFMNHKF